MKVFAMFGKEIPVTFTNRGMQIMGVLHRPPVEGNPPGVVFYHGCTGSRAEAHWIFVKLARHLASLGIMTLRFDFRCSGESEGSFENMTLSDEISDGFRAHEYLLEECGADPRRTGIMGISMGGVVASYVAGGLGGKLQSCVLLNPVARPLENLSYIANSRSVNVVRFPIEYNSFLFGRAFFDELSSLHPLEEISRAACPVLVVNGSGDKTISPVCSQEYFEVLRKNSIPSELFVIEGADHTFASSNWEKAVMEKTGGWLKNIFFP